MAQEVIADSSIIPISSQRAKKDPNACKKICNVCGKLLGRHLFSKKEFQKPSPSLPTCHQCRRNQTAQRCKQEPKAQMKQGRKTDSGIVRRPNNFGYCDYLDHLFSMNCFPDIVALQAFASAKDVSESMAALQAVSKHGLLNFTSKVKKPRVNCLCIGDGSTPRSAVLACFLRQWNCISIDPALHADWNGKNPKGVRGLTGFAGTLEDFLRTEAGPDVHCDLLVLLCVHSHARLIGTASISNIMVRYRNPSTTLVSLPCCPKFRSHKDVGRPPDVQYEDDCVFSACRKVEIWNFGPSDSQATAPFCQLASSHGV